MLTGREVGAEKPSTHYPIKTPILSPCDLPNLSLGQLPQVQQLPRVQRTPIPRLTHVSRLYADHSVGGARQAPDADPLDSVCGWLRGARRAAAGPQRSQCPHQRPGRSAPLGPGVIQTLPLLVWAPSLLPGPEPGIPQLLACLGHPPAVPDFSVCVPCPRCFLRFSLFFPGHCQEPCLFLSNFPTSVLACPRCLSVSSGPPMSISQSKGGHPVPSMPALASSQPVPPSQPTSDPVSTWHPLILFPPAPYVFTVSPACPRHHHAPCPNTSTPVPLYSLLSVLNI